MIKIEYASNFEEIETITEKLLTEYDNENNVKYNFKKFAFVARENNEQVGYVNGFSYYSEVTINNLVVMKEFRGRGIGTRLVDYVFNYFKDKNFNNLNLVTNEFQAPGFYKKCGFELEFIRKNCKNPKLTKYFFVKYFNESR